jgi:hypothetical protein
MKVMNSIPRIVAASFAPAAGAADYSGAMGVPFWGA